MNRIRLGGFTEAAGVLSALSGFPWSRQRVQQFWKRQQEGDVNGFPDFHDCMINGHRRYLFDMADIADWYGYVEAANHIASLTGKLWMPSQVYRLHQQKQGFPRRMWIDVGCTEYIEMRIGFDLDELADYVSRGGLD